MEAVGPMKFVEPFLRELKPRSDFGETHKYAKCMGAWVADIGHLNAGTVALY